MFVKVDVCCGWIQVGVMNIAQRHNVFKYLPDNVREGNPLKHNVSVEAISAHAIGKEHSCTSI